MVLEYRIQNGEYILVQRYTRAGGLGLSHRLDPGRVVSDCSVAGPTTELALKPQPTDRCVVVSRYRLTENSTA